MKKQYVNDLSPGSSCDSQFVATHKRLAEFRNKPGQQYLSVALRDRTGQVDARAWDNGPALAMRFENGDVIHVQGKVELFNKAPQVVISTIRRCKAEEYHLADFLPRTPRDINLLIETIHQAIDQITNPHLRQLLDSFYRDPAFLLDFKRAPAAKSIHHAYLGGLAEHFCTVLALAQTMCAHYSRLDPDLLITGILLHDIGKLRELRLVTQFEYSDEGKLLGHVHLGAQMVAEKIAGLPDFPKSLAMQVVHMILSHHGEHEYGAPVLPVTAEAIAVHLLENCDAKLHHFFSIVESARDPEQVWTEYDRRLGRQLYTGRGELGLPSTAPSSLTSTEESTEEPGGLAEVPPVAALESSEAPEIDNPPPDSQSLLAF